MEHQQKYSHISEQATARFWDTGPELVSELMAAKLFYGRFNNPRLAVIHEVSNLKEAI